jgi:hypothetical protein
MGHLRDDGHGADPEGDDDEVRELGPPNATTSGILADALSFLISAPLLRCSRRCASFASNRSRTRSAPEGAVATPRAGCE